MHVLGCNIYMLQPSCVILQPSYDYIVTYLLVFVLYGLFIALLLSTWFYCSIAFLLLCRYLLDFIALSSFYFLLAICLFSLLCGRFVAKILGRHWLQIIMLWSGGAVNLRIRFWPTLCYIFDLIFRAKCLGFLWLDSCGFELVWKRALRAFQWC